MKTELTKHIEYLLFKHTNILGTYGCKEVKIGGTFTKEYITPHVEYVDYMTVDSKGVITCYEIKTSKQDLYSDNRLSFHGHKNYIVMPEELFNEVKNESDFLWLVNKKAGAIVVNDKGELKKGFECYKTDLPIGKATILLESFARSTARETAKLYELEHKNETT
ncbi:MULTISPECIES: hypothetical protein [Granulicatella]|uniref:hypothetical protein n=1 Tax=Granulicatella TaxID=117563 RepID=UPI00066BCA1D|nr:MULTISPECIES: hypothetical protein [unclassified Granulicatella]